MPQPFVLPDSVTHVRCRLASVPVCLEQCIEDRLQRMVPSSELHPQPLHRAMRHALFSGGKLIRPQLLLQIAGACGADLYSSWVGGASSQMIVWMCRVCPRWRASRSDRMLHTDVLTRWPV